MLSLRRKILRLYISESLSINTLTSSKSALIQLHDIYQEL